MPVNQRLSNIRRFDRPAMAGVSASIAGSMTPTQPLLDSGRTQWPLAGAFYVEQERTFVPSAGRRVMMVPCGVAFHERPEAGTPAGWMGRRCRARNGKMFGG